MTWQLRARPEDSTNALVARSTAVCRSGAGPSSATNEHGLTARLDGLVTGSFSDATLRAGATFRVQQRGGGEG